jgi:hypothetical protein
MEPRGRKKAAPTPKKKPASRRLGITPACWLRKEAPVHEYRQRAGNERARSISPRPPVPCRSAPCRKPAARLPCVRG